MDRRKSLKVMVLGSVSSGVLLDACKTEDSKAVANKVAAKPTEKKRLGLMKEEVQHLNEVAAYKFFTSHEMQTITVLADIIIPKDQVSGSASDAKVPDFIEFIVKDQPDNKVPMRGGLQWLDMQCLNRYGKVFADCDPKKQMEIVDEIAWPKKAKPGMKPGVNFFNLMRNLTATGFYTSEIGVKDVGYLGNTPNQWNGVPDDVLKKHNLAYTPKELAECVSF
ncbi:MAG TPA: gluconate 2-dehydrogenase subunit 3 family protein [Hanamia sp.]